MDLPDAEGPADPGPDAMGVLALLMSILGATPPRAIPARHRARRADPGCGRPVGRRDPRDAGTWRRRRR